MKWKGRNISLPVVITILFMFVVINIAYYFVTQKVLVDEASKRLDQITDYISYYITQVTTSEHEKLKLIEDQTQLISKSIVKELGPNFKDIDQSELNEVQSFFKLDSLQIEKKINNIQSSNEFIIENRAIRYKYSEQEIDYNLNILINDVGNTVREGIDNHLNGMVKARSNYYKEKMITYEFSLFIKPEAGFQSIAESTGFGTYTLLKPDDVKYLNQASKEKVIVYDQMNGKELEKYFMPIVIGDKTYVSCLISDYGTMKEVMMDQVSMYVLTIVVCSIAFIVLCIVITKIFNRNKTKALETVHSDYLSSMEDIFLTMKQQRHDFNNSVAIIHSLIVMKEYEELHTLTEEMIDETTELNDMLNINCVAVIALLQYKRTYANKNGILFNQSIINLKEIPDIKYRTTDINRVLGNLIDNAFEAVKTAKKVKTDYTPEVTVNGYLESNKLIFTVSNNGLIISPEEEKQMFEPGYSTKDNGTGLGLSIITSLVEKNKGKLTFTSSDELTTFKVTFLVQLEKSTV